MTNKSYTDEIYDYLTLPDNYQSAMELQKQLSQVDQQLQVEFWEMVTKDLESKINKESPILEFKRNRDWFDIRQNDWEFYIISTDNESVGIEMKSGYENELKCHEQAIKTEIEKSVNIDEYKSLTWPCWKTFDNYRFQTNEEKLKILPSLREKKISDCANELFDYVKTIIPVCDKINKKIKEIGQ